MCRAHPGHIRILNKKADENKSELSIRFYIYGKKIFTDDRVKPTAF
jgi:hypothetical protein